VSFSKNRAVILDRDGVINEDRGYVHTLEDFELLPRVAEALRLLPQDFRRIVITNQSGIMRGLYSEKQFLSLMSSVRELLLKEGVHFDAVYHCPHLPTEDCDCRKPRTALLEQAIEEFDLDPKKCFVIGDQTSDIKMGEDGGCRTILVKTGRGGEDGNYCVKPNYVAQDLYDAVRYILLTESHGEDEVEDV
jgi:D-glycero-D-manno-heptose 1,7-bisphosphate phosphatase